MNRREARELMMQTFYQMDMTGDFETSFEDATNHKELGNQVNYCKTVFQVVCDHKETIDEQISRHSVGWKMERMPKTDIATLRLATGELVFMDDIPVAVSINEAVELAKKFGTDQSPKFVNAILGSIAKENA